MWHSKNMYITKYNVSTIMLFILFSLLCFNTSAWFSTFLFNSFEMDASSYITDKIIFSDKKSKIVQDVESRNFLENNYFNIGYYFNYLYPSKTFFHISNMHDSYGENLIFGATDTGMSSSDYISYNLLGFRVEDGLEFQNNWNSNECYITKNHFIRLFGETVVFKELEFSILENGNNLSIRGLISNESAKPFEYYYNNIIIVSYKYGVEKFEQCDVTTIFENPDRPKVKRFLNHYFGMYLNDNNKWNQKIRFENIDGERFTIENKYRTNYSIPLLLLILSIVFMVAFLLFCHFVFKKPFLLSKTLSIYFYSFLFIFIHFIFLLFSKQMSGLGFIIYSPIEIIITFALGIVIIVSFNYLFGDFFRKLNYLKMRI